MNLEQLIAGMENQNSTAKTAAENTGTTDSKLQEALATSLEKTAAVSAATVVQPSSDPAMDLMKMAAQLAGTEKEAELAHAHLLGQAIVDGMIAKAAMYDAQIKTAMAKEAASQPQTQASDVATAIKEAEARGYNAAVQQFSARDPNYNTKLAEAQFEAGFNSQVKEIHDVACGEFMKGAAEAEILINMAQQQQAAGR